MSMSSSSTMSRSVYLSHVRRAFLLRVHPDRFRTHPVHVRSQQASLVQALSNRLGHADVADWQSYRSPSNNSSSSSSLGGAASLPSISFPFMLERRDGSYLTSTLQLGESVESILQGMVTALEKSGAASLPPPPSTKVPESDAAAHDQEGTAQGDSTMSSSSSPSIDPKYEVNSLRGRDLVSFLSHTSPDSLKREIQKRRESRVHAQASAAEVRKRYEFLLVDATSLHWSSASVAVLLRRLLSLHDEHQTKLHVPSMYPIQLQLTTASLSADGTPVLDVHGGVLRLHPAATPLQWLESLQLVTHERLQQIQYRQRVLHERTQDLSSVLGGAKLVKGHSCSSRDYHAFVQHLHEALVTDGRMSSTAGDGSALALEPIMVTVEASQAVRRAQVTSEGHVRLQTGMTPAQAVESIRSLAPKARTARQTFAAGRESCAHVISQLQYRAGLNRVYRANSRVPAHDYANALSRLLNLVTAPDPSSFSHATGDEGSDVRLLLQRTLAGNSLGIAASGHFCHLGDDGSLVIPHDWR